MEKEVKRALVEIEHGSLSSSQILNRNFQYLDERITSYSSSLSSINTQINTSLANLNTQITNQIANGVPTGVIQAFAGSTAPTGWLLCNGQAVSRTVYNKLFAVIGTTYGSGDGSTTFNVPNLVNRFVEGSTTAGTVKEAALPNIKGSFILNGTTLGGSTGACSQTNVGSSSCGYDASYALPQTTIDASRSNSIYKNDCNTVQPPAVTMLYIIKT